MAISSQRDADLLRARLAAWLAVRLGSPVDVTVLPGPAFSGFSNETLLADAGWTADGRACRLGLAVRVAPTGHRVFPDARFETQVEVMRALAPTPVPVPQVLWFEPDPAVLGAPFFVMRRLEGMVPPDNPPYHVAGWLSEAPPEVREAVWSNGLTAMTALHGLDPDALGPVDLPRLDAPAALADVRAYLAWVLEGRSYPPVEAALAALAGGVPGPSGPVAPCWGDARIGNVMYDDAGGVVAVLDWEMVNVGEPLADLAWFLLLDRHHSEACGVPRLAGFPSHAETVAAWEEATGRSAAALSWWLRLGAVRYAAILTRVMDLLDGSGLLPGAAAMAFDNTSTVLLRSVMAEG